jgi:hypothetical protein
MHSLSQRTLEHRQLLELVERGVRRPWVQNHPALALIIHRWDAVCVGNASLVASALNGF